MIAFGVCYYFSGDIYYFLAEPLADVLRKARAMHAPHLIYTQLYEAFFTKIKVAMFGAAFSRLPDHRLAALAVHRARACIAARSARCCRSWSRRRCCS